MSYFERITSKDNTVIKNTSKLLSAAKYRREKGLFVLDGLRLCKDAALNNFPIEQLIIGESAFNKFQEDSFFLSERANKSYIVPDHIISKISDTVNPQGFLCVCAIPNMDSFSVNPDGLYIALENISDPSNLGAIARSAEAFNFDGIIVSEGGCDPYNPKALRASMGALLRIPVIVMAQFYEFIADCGLNTYATVVDQTADSIKSADFKKGSIALIGNEANGLTDTAIASCKKRITIPMTGKAESLNAATAAAIVMWEMSCLR